MKKWKYLGALLALLSFNAVSHGDDEHQYRSGAKAYIITPKDGQTVSKTFTIKFGVMGMSVSPAGVEKANSGHHHLLLDGKKLPDLSKPLGTEVKHFGGGQTETTISLEPGKHTLQLIMGDHQHKPHTPPVISSKISIIVE